ENVYSLNLSKTTKKANAMFAGIGRTKRLVLSDTLIQNFTVDEIESVVAHELGHFKHRDIWHHFGFNLITSFVSFALVFHVLGFLTPHLGYKGVGDLAAFPLLYLMFYFFGLLLNPLSNAYSRWREREADRFSLKAVGSGGFIPAMEKLARLNLTNPKPHPLVVWWFYTHPPIEERIRMAKSMVTCFAFFFLLNSASLSFAAKEDSEREEARKAVEMRGRTEILSYFYGDPKNTTGVKVPIAIDLYNQAVEFYQKKEYDLARQVLQDSLRYDSKNPFAYELLGDIAYYEQKLDEAEKHYESAYRLRAQTSLKEKILKIQKEKKVESGLSTYQEEHFIIKYHGEEKRFEGFELRELLRTTYRSVGQDFGYFFKHKVAVLLYDEKEFRNLSGAPHWSSGLYDGKVRLPAYKKGFADKEIQKIVQHEVTHAFVVEISRARCPAWLNEGLAVYEEAKIEPRDPRVFKAAVRTNTLLPLPSLFSQEQIQGLNDPLEVALFYDQAYQVVNYIVGRYGMFRVKQMLETYAQGKDTHDVIQEVLKISPLELEKRWKETLTSN
ncbi:MAG: M48 family metalloprotease, partial [Candidatus Omnitrophica bacterium]|nr:M48 family metalloprotease [Candidatus Omnitrophota bacterium]